VLARLIHKTKGYHDGIEVLSKPRTKIGTDDGLSKFDADAWRKLLRKDNVSVFYMGNFLCCKGDIVNI
jgi:hypothetical protein